MGETREIEEILRKGRVVEDDALFLFYGFESGDRYAADLRKRM